MLRIIGGTARGKKINFPTGSKERPTSDFLKENIFNILGSLEDKNFLDLFAGSGSVGLEAASRHAREVYFVEKNKRLADTLRKNISACCQNERCYVMVAESEKAFLNLFKRGLSFDIIFADPPYNRNLVSATLTYLNRHTIMAKDGMLVVQHSIKENFDHTMGHLEMTHQRKYGENALTFFKWRENDAR